MQDRPKLTARQQQIFDLVRNAIESTGAPPTRAEIAAELFIAEQTVKTHVGKVLSKLGLRDRVHAVILAYDTGLVEPSS